MATIRDFGRLPDGTVVQEVSLKKGPLEAKVLTYGAIIRDLAFNGKTLVLGFEDLESYLQHDAFFGAVAGRCANRISNGRFEIDGHAYQLAQNVEGKHHLHGGNVGFANRIWSLEQHDKASVLLKLVSEDGDEGYPGRVEVLCRYTLTGAGALRVKFTATTDKTTIVNVTQHSYFNLAGTPDILDHTLEIAADRYLPVTGDFVPSGEIRKVEWTPYDFREGRKLRRRASETDVIFDHNFCLSDEPLDQVAFAAALEDPEGESRMEVWTTEPGIQLYDGYKIETTSRGLNGAYYGACAGLCLETQRWPDSVNHDNFTGVHLHPDETYNHVTEFRFS
ncbi:aldose epimerase family protein [Labrenzia sp. CE80]|uniref:aldose epimerase family protein n=1 Tax=Labrenzia sp. CE80 TaxID=1788986 RepID=UPI00129B780A|nr:aldose epimerase family protein [Labrenzia sp. CE80]